MGIANVSDLLAIGDLLPRQCPNTFLCTYLFFIEQPYLISLYMVLSINQCSLFKQFVNNHVYCYKVFKLKYLLVLCNNIQWKEMKSLTL